MCHFISWIDLNGEIFFLDDIKLNTKEGRELLKDEFKDDILGHGAIRHYYPELGSRGKDCECVDFSSPKNFPAEIVKAVKRGLFQVFNVCPDILTSPALAEFIKISDTALAEYNKISDPAWAEYKKISDPAWAEFKKIRDPALAEYKKIRDPALAEYNKISDTAWAEYKKISDPAWAEYKKISNTAFWDLAMKKKNRKRNWK